MMKCVFKLFSMDYIKNSAFHQKSLKVQKPINTNSNNVLCITHYIRL